MVGTDDPDFAPNFMTEKLVVVSAMIIGALVMSLIIGNISDIIANADPGKTARKQAEGIVRFLPSLNHCIVNASLAAGADVVYRSHPS